MQTSRPIPDYLPLRLCALRRAMAENKLDAFLIVHPTDLAYFTDFDGEDSLGLVTDKGLTILTDFRFDEQVQIEAPWFKRIIRKGTMNEALAKSLDKAMVRRVGFEPNHLTVGAFRGIQKELADRKIRDIKLAPVGGVTGNIRKVKDQKEIALIRQAVKIAEEAFDALRRKIVPGVTENQLTGLLDLEVRSRGGSGMGFPAIVCVGENASLCHYRPGEVPVRSGAVLLIDWGVSYKGYTSDMTRTLLVGNVTPRMREIYQIVLDAQQAAIDRIRPGVSGKDVDLAARNLIKKAGFGKYFGHSVGHGIGRLVHESPFMRSTKGAVVEELRAGMVVTVEPGIYLPGEGGVRIEDDVLVTQTGHEVLSSMPRDIGWAQMD
jgi:Xaa-Pro aminopeptidase